MGAGGDSSYSTLPVYCNTVRVFVELPVVMVIELPYPAVGSPRELNVIFVGSGLKLIAPSKILVKFLVLVPTPAAGNSYSVELLNVRVLLAC